MSWRLIFMQETFAVGGTISGEHGDGLSRTPFVRQQYGELYDVFRDLKRIFDPAGILNPGKIVSDDNELVVAKLAAAWLRRGNVRRRAHLGQWGRRRRRSTVELQLNWTCRQLTGRRRGAATAAGHAVRSWATCECARFFA